MKYIGCTAPAVALALLVYAAPARAVTENDTTKVTVSGTLIGAPECTVNGNNLVDVDFGDSIVTHFIDGETYMKKELIYSLSCTGLNSTRMKITVRGTEAEFGTGLIKTSIAGLGIQLMNGTTKIKAGEYINFTHDGTTSALPKLSAVLVAKDAQALKASAFTGAGTMVLGYQ